MEPTNIITFSDDKPGSDPTRDDRLNYGPFAKHLADSICKMIPADGFVIGIHGSWGSGKTTLLQFIMYYLRQLPSQDQPIIVQFNPWWFSGEGDLTTRFFDQVQTTLSSSHVMWERLRSPLMDLADVASESLKPYIPIVSPAMKKITERLLKKKDPHLLKEKICRLLRESKKRILVVVDDVDRLTAPQIRQLFALIKAVADFPFLTYLLAFDKDIVRTALTKM
jgi:predicted KAP-like P-loop ATPase